MNKEKRTGAIGALLDEYEKAIAELKVVIAPVTDDALVFIVDEHTADPNCHSIQHVLTHVVRSAYGYAMYCAGMPAEEINGRKSNYYNTSLQYQQALDDAFLFTVEQFKPITDDMLEVFEEEKKIRTNWGQVYDIEQLMEHAIVHILRHRRQIEKFRLMIAER